MSSTSRPVRLSLVLGVLLALLVAVAGWRVLRCSDVTTLVLVRHADRDGSRDALTPTGVARSRELVHAVEKLGLTAVFHSDTLRARDTAAALALALGVPVNERPAADVSGLVQEILRQHRGERVLVVGHSNTVPRLITAAGGPELPDIAHDEFDDLFVLSTCGCWRGPSQLSRLQYGAPSP